MKKTITNKKVITRLIIGILFMLIMLSYATGCSSIDSSIKSFESEVSGGLNRVVKVYSPNGQILSTYEGKINIEYDESRVIFQIDRDKRIAVYSDTAIVLVEEK